MPADPSPDSLLVARARQGDRAAWAELYERYADRLHDYATRLTGSRTEAADCVQDAFVLAVQRVGQLRDPDKVRPWLYAIVRSTAHRHYRRVDRWAFGEVPDVAPPGSGDDAVIAGLTAAEVAGLVTAAAAGLTDDDREVLDLSLGHDLAPAEIAAALGVSTRHAAVTTERMRERLGRSITVTLLARRPACAEFADLAAIESPLSPLSRKRLARHVDGCATCTDQAEREVRPAALLAVAPLPLLLLPRRAFADLAPSLDAAIESAIDTARRGTPLPDGGLEWDDDGFPRPLPGRGRTTPLHRAAIAGGAMLALVVAVLVAVLVVGRVADDSPRAADAPAAAGPATPATPTTPVTSTSGASGPLASDVAPAGEPAASAPDPGATSAGGDESPVPAGRPTTPGSTVPVDPAGPTASDPSPAATTSTAPRSPTAPTTAPAATVPASTAPAPTVPGPGTSAGPATTAAPGGGVTTTTPPAATTTAAPTTVPDTTGPAIGSVTASVASISVVSGGLATCYQPPAYVVLSPTATVISVPVSDPSGVGSVTFTWSTGWASGSGVISGSAGTWSATLADLPTTAAPRGAATEVAVPMSVTVMATDGGGRTTTVTRPGVVTVRNCYVVG